MRATWRQRLGADLAGSVARAALDADLGGAAAERELVTEGHLRDLPEPVQRYLRFMRVLDRRRDRSFTGAFVGRFRQRPRGRWMSMRAWQYSSSHPVARIFHLQLRTPYLLPMVGADTYVGGRGRMHGTLGGLVTVVDGQGPAFDEGELVTYLNDAVLVAPGMLLGAARWVGRGDDVFEVGLTDHARTVSATVTLRSDGAPVSFTTTDRSIALHDGPVRARWTTPVDGWAVIGGRPLPTSGSAVWNLPDGPFTYAAGRFVPGTMRFDVDPVRPYEPAVRVRAAARSR